MSTPKRLLLFLLLTGASFATRAQTGTCQLTGTLVDAADRSAVVQATVQLLALPDSTLAKGTVTDNHGSFRISGIRPGHYLLRISYVGYRPYQQETTLSSRQRQTDVGTLSLQADAIWMEGTVVVAEAPPVTQLEDTTVFHASAYRVAEGAVLEDLVKRLPGAEVNADGRVTVNGKEIKKVMVDGKEFFGDDTRLALKNLPAEMVDKVKTYDKKSDLARVTGIDDGEDEAVLDLTVKKGMKQGWFGNLIGGYGSYDRYEAGLMANRFTDGQQITALGSANNTNNQGFSEFGDAGQGLGGNAGNGINTSQAAGLNIARATRQAELGGNIQYGHSCRDAEARSTTETFLQNGSSLKNGLSTSLRDRHDLSANFRLEWKPDSLTNILFRPSATYSHTDTRSRNLSTTLNTERDSVNQKHATNHNLNSSLSARGSLQVNRRLRGKKGRNLTLRLNYSHNERNADKWSDSETYFYRNDSTARTNRFNDGGSTSDSYKVQLTYTEPVGKNRYLQFGYSYQYKQSHSQKYVYPAVDGVPGPSDTRMDSLSNEISNRYSTQECFVSFRTVRPKYTYHIGLNVEPQYSSTTTLLGPNRRGTLAQHVCNFSPTLDLRLRFSKQEQLRILYRGRSAAPNIDDLQEVKDATDPMNLVYGNPSLKPSYASRFILFYNRFDKKTQRNLMVNVSANHTLNSTAQRIDYDEETGARATRLLNVNGNWGTQGNLSFNTPLKNRKFNIAAYTDLQYQHLIGYTSTGNVDSEKSATHSLNLMERLNGNYRNEVLEVGLSASVRYGRSHNNHPAADNRETFDYEAGLQTHVDLPWDLRFSTDLGLHVQRGYGAGYDRCRMLWNAQLSKNFLRKKQATIRLKVYDILQQQSNLTRTIAANYTQDNEYNTLNSYFIVHFVYRLNTLGGKNAPRGPKNQPGRPSFGPERRRM